MKTTLSDTLKRAAGLILSAVTAFSVMSSCGEAQDAPAAGTAAAVTDAAPGETAEAESTREPLDVPAADYGGYEFRVLARLDDIYWVTEDVWTETQNGEPVNDAVYRRNSRISEKLGVNITQHLESDVRGSATKAVRSGDDEFGAFLGTLNDVAPPRR